MPLSSYDDIPSGFPKREIPDFTDTSVYPEIEEFLNQDFDKQFDDKIFQELFTDIFENPVWKGTNLYYAIQAYIKFIKDDIGLELNQLYNFLDPYFLKGFSGTEVQNVYQLSYTENQIFQVNDEIILSRAGNNITIQVFEVIDEKNYMVIINTNSNNVEPVNFWVDENNTRVSLNQNIRLQNKYNAYFERFFELFNSYVSYLQAYLDTIENNDDFVNVNKKDLLIYFGKKIYEYRGTAQGFAYIENVFNPVSYVNRLTGSIVKVPLSIELEENGELELIENVPEEKVPYVYGLGISNISNAELKIAILKILDTLIHPAGYKSSVSDFVNFLITMNINTTLYNTIDKSIKHSYYIGNDDEIVSTGLLETVEFNDPDDYVDYVHMKTYTVNDGTTDMDFSYGN